MHNSRGGWPDRRFGRRAPLLRRRSAATDVVEMVNRVVDEIPRERLDRELRPVAPEASSLPLIAGNLLEPGRDDLGRLDQLVSHLARILVGIPAFDRGRILVPVRVARTIDSEHQREPGIACFWNPLVSSPHSGQGALQHPGPVLGVGHDRHSSERYRRLCRCPDSSGGWRPIRTISNCRRVSIDVLPATAPIDSTFAYVGTTDRFEAAGFRRVAETGARSAGLPRFVMRLDLTG